MFDNGYEFKRYLPTLLNDFSIKYVLTKNKNPQDNDQVENVHRVILNMLVTKGLDKKLFEYIDPWG